MKFIAKILALFMLSSAGVSCAATPDTLSQRADAVLLNADRSEVREAIRIFVRQNSGRFVIADPDTLTQSPVLVVRRRARDYESKIRKLPTANLNYRLLSNGRQCWLVRHESSLGSPIASEVLLPETAQCAVYTQR